MRNKQHMWSFYLLTVICCLQDDGASVLQSFCCSTKDVRSTSNSQEWICLGEFGFLYAKQLDT